MLRRLFIVFLFISCILSAQNERIAIYGLILNEGKPQQNIHIFNVSTNQGSISNESGRFRIFVKENDTLLVSGIQFYSVGVPVTKKIIDKKSVTIELMQRINTLSEVRIYSNKLNGFLLVDAEKEKPMERPHKKATELPDVYIPSKSVAKKLDPDYLPDPTDPAPEGGGDIIGLVNLLTNNSLEKAGKSVKSDSKQLQKAKLILEIHRYFGNGFFTEQLKIPLKEIDIFIVYTDRDDRASKYFRQKKYLQLTDLLYRSSFSFKSM